MHQNIASLTSKKNLLEVILAQLDEDGKQPDVICLTETFIEIGNELNININGYTLSSIYCRTRKQRRGGVCILVKNGVAFNTLNLIKKHASDEVFECCGTSIPSHNMIVICIYRTPKSRALSFLNILEATLHDICTKYSNKKIILAGDLNINILNDSKDTKVLFDIAKNYNLTFHIDKPTRQNTCIDNIMSNISDARGDLLHLGLSDHDTAQMLFVPINKLDVPLKYYYVFKRDYNKDHMEMFRKHLKNLSFSASYKHSDLNLAFEEFYQIFTLLYYLCFPKSRVKITNKISRPRWLTKGLKVSCKTKRDLQRKFYRQKSEDNKIKYHNYSKTLKRCFNIAERKSNDKYVTNSKNKCRASWDIIKEYSNIQMNKKFITEVNIKGKISSNPNEIAKSFNEYFIDLTNKDDQNCYNTNKTCVSSTIFLRPFTIKEVIQIIMSLNDTNAVGYDEIRTKVIKYCKDELAPILTYLINESFCQGCFPNALKLSTVKPLHKKGDKSLLSNYRPITLVPILSKIFEKAMHKRITDFTNKFKIFKTVQFGFQHNKSTTQACFNMVSQIVKNIDEKKLVISIFIDMTKAFDFVSHKILIQKLNNFGIRGPALEWIESFLKCRKQNVEISNINDRYEIETFKSTYEINNYGVPQGSILGPLLFLFYINDLPDITNNNNMTLFADDISILLTCNDNNIEKFESDINYTLKSIIVWLEQNNLRINITKTNYIQFRHYNTKHLNLNVNYAGNTIKEVENCRFLGVYVDQHCSWKCHIDSVCNRLNRFVYVLRRLVKTSSINTALTAYHGYISSVLRYGLMIWGNSTEVNRAFIVQKKCIRAIFNMAPYQSCKPAFKKLKILPVPCMYILEIAKFVKMNSHIFKTVHDNVEKRALRYQNKLVFDRISKTALYQKNCYAMCVKIFNKLPEDIKTLPFKQFVFKLIKWLNGKNFYSVRQFLTQSDLNDKRMLHDI